MQTALIIPRRVLTVDRSQTGEVANTFTHGLGIFLNLAGLAYLLYAAPGRLSPAILFASLLFAILLVILYSVSTLSHGIQQVDWKSTWRAWDQGVIYLVIAGSYTPLAVGFVGATWLPFYLLALWGLALLGFSLKVFARHQVETVALSFYLFLGLGAALPLIAFIPYAPLVCLAASCASYLVGTIFLALDGKYPIFHAVWHIFVLLGTSLSFLCIVRYLVLAESVP